ncbi:Transcription termination factor MTERF6, chloroplastic/mitochondrial [Linum perenne]
MFESLAATVRRSRIGNHSIYRLIGFLRYDSPPSSLRRPFSSSSSIKKKESESSFTVSYLVNRCGISSSRASAVSKYINFESPKTPDEVLSFFREHNFSQSQITAILGRHPILLQCSPTRSFLPKLHFLRSLGFSDPDVVKIVSVCPRILSSSLQKQLIPSFEFFKEYYQSNNEAVAAAIKLCPRMLINSLHREVLPILGTLREAGAPQNAISMFVRQKLVISWNPDKFRSVVADVIAMGIDPGKIIFISAILVKWSLSEATWEKKVALYEKWGWSREQALHAFKKWPNCFKASEDKIDGTMELFVNQLGCESSYIADRPILFTYSLEKRLRPRAFVLQFLVSKGLLCNDHASPKLFFFGVSEEAFLEKYIHPYSESCADLLNMYLEKKSGHSCSSLEDTDVRISGEKTRPLKS